MAFKSLTHVWNKPKEKMSGGKRMKSAKFNFQKGSNRKRHTEGSKWLLLVH